MSVTDCCGVDDCPLIAISCAQGFQRFEDIGALEDFWQWAEGPLVESISSQSFPDGQVRTCHLCPSLLFDIFFRLQVAGDTA